MLFGQVTSLREVLSKEDPNSPGCNGGHDFVNALLKVRFAEGPMAGTMKEAAVLKYAHERAHKCHVEEQQVRGTVLAGYSF